MRHALEALGLPCPPDDALAAHIGPPLRRAFERLMDTTARDSVERAMAFYRERYTRTGLYEASLFEGIAPMLDALRAAHPRAALLVATSKPAVYAERVLRHLGVRDAFAAVHGPDLDGRLDAKGELLAHLLRAERLSPGGAVMIGDRAADVIAARENGLRSVGVTWGYGTAVELRDAGADALCAAPAELPRTLAAKP